MHRPAVHEGIKANPPTAMAVYRRHRTHVIVLSVSRVDCPVCVLNGSMRLL